MFQQFLPEKLPVQLERVMVLDQVYPPMDLLFPLLHWILYQNLPVRLPNTGTEDLEDTLHTKIVKAGVNVKFDIGADF